MKSHHLCNLPVGTPVRVDHGTGVIKGYEVYDEKSKTLSVTYLAPKSEELFRYEITLDPGHSWPSNLTYCATPHQVTAI